jgi:hypothetical protein
MHPITFVPSLSINVAPKCHFPISVILDNVIPGVELCFFKLIKKRPIGYFECKCTCSGIETDEIFCCIEQG